MSACDVDARHVKWVSQNLSYVDVIRTSVSPPLPYRDKEFDAITSISVFTHLTEKSQDEFFAELRRICASEGVLFLRSTVLARWSEHQAVSIQEMIAVDGVLFEKARQLFARGEHAFILQHGHPHSFCQYTSAMVIESNGAVCNQPTFSIWHYIHPGNIHFRALDSMV